MSIVVCKNVCMCMRHLCTCRYVCAEMYGSALCDKLARNLPKSKPNIVCTLPLFANALHEIHVLKTNCIQNCSMQKHGM